MNTIPILNPKQRGKYYSSIEGSANDSIKSLGVTLDFDLTLCPATRARLVELIQTMVRIRHKNRTLMRETTT